MIRTGEMSDKKSTDSSIEETLLKLARPKRTPKELLSLVRRAHPRASKKEIIRAAFGTIIAIADREPESAQLLQDFALNERVGDDDQT